MALYRQREFLFTTFCLCCILQVPGRFFGSYKRPAKSHQGQRECGIYWQETRPGLLLEHLYLAELAVLWSGCNWCTLGLWRNVLSPDLKDHSPPTALKMKIEDVRRQDEEAFIFLPLPLVTFVYVRWPDRHALLFHQPTHNWK